MQDVVGEGVDPPHAPRPTRDGPGPVHSLFPGAARLQPHYTRAHAARTVLSYGLQYYRAERQPRYGQSEFHRLLC